MGQKLQDIPKEFYSFDTGAPFTQCIECERLLTDDVDYMIEKSVRNYRGFNATDVIFDYAICLVCVDEMKKNLSSQSLQAIHTYFMEHFDSENHMAVGIDHCLVSKKSREECEEYQLYALCQGAHLSEIQPPYMISGEVIDELLPLLSKATSDNLDGFFNKHFSPDPSLMAPTPPRPLLI